MRDIHTIVLHCSASDDTNHDDISVIRRWHIMRGFNDVGYHFFIKKDGTIQEGRDINTIGAHVQGHNTGTVGICLSGLNSFTQAQVTSANEVIKKIRSLLSKDIPVVGHNSYTTQKTCPNVLLPDFLNGKIRVIKTYK